MSYMWYTCFGTVTTIIVALLSTVVFGTNKFEDIDATLIAPCMRKYLNLDERKTTKNTVNFSIFDTMLKFCSVFFNI